MSAVRLVVTDATIMRLRKPDAVLMPRAERQAFMAAIEEWAAAIERGEL